MVPRHRGPRETIDFRRTVLYIAVALCVGSASARAASETSQLSYAAIDDLPGIRMDLALGDSDELEQDFDMRPGSKPGITLQAPSIREPDVPDREQIPAGTVPSETGKTPNATISDDISQLPEPVRRMRELIIEAAKSGDPERLRPLIATGANGTQLSIVEYDSDPIDYLKQNSGDGKGQEILAILLDILTAGYAHVDEGEPTEMYIWPYFYAMPLDGLSDPQMVELFRIMTAGDFEDMKDFGSYIFYRVGISPDGDWRFFVAGD